MKLRKESLEFAKLHIQNYFDSDFYPKPVEFDAIFSEWNHVVEYLTSNNLEELEYEKPTVFAAPKPVGGYRIVHQLDPISSIVYTALAYEIAEIVEKKRVPADWNVVCSYRIKLGNNGSFFESHSDDNSFDERSLKLCDNYKYVLITDITNFYNQIYLEKLQQVIQQCDSSLAELSKTIEFFLKKINNGISLGIPTGPLPSIIMAETLMIDVDNFLLGKGLEYTRYVDDFKIYSNSRFELELLAENLSQYLYQEHRLALSSSKTRIIETNYLRIDLSAESKAKRRELKEKIKNIQYLNSTIDVDGDDYPADFDSESQRTELMEIMQDIQKKKNLDLGLIRKTIRISKKIGSTDIIEQLLRNFDFYAPAIRDIVLYFEEVTDSEMIDSNIKYFEKLIKTSNKLKLPFVEYWMHHYFSNHAEFADKVKIRKFILNKDNVRNLVNYANKTNNYDIIRSYKNKYYNLPNADKRALIFASQILPEKECLDWLSGIEKRSSNLLESIMIKYIKSTYDSSTLEKLLADIDF